MRKQSILIAAQQLIGGSKGKGGVVTAHVAEVGTEIDEDEADRLGLTHKDIEDLMNRGFIVQQLVRSAGDGPGDADASVVEGISVEEFTGFLDRHAILYPLDATVDQLLAIEPVDAGGITQAALGIFLDLHEIGHAEDATAEDMLTALLQHGSADSSGDDPFAAVATQIEADMDVKAIKAELAKLQVPFETDANKSALAQLLARSRQPA